MAIVNKTKDPESVVLDKYGRMVISQNRHGGLNLFRASIVEGDDSRAIGYAPTAEVYIDSNAAMRLRDILNKWYPPTHDQLVQFLADHHNVGKDDITIDLGGDR